VVLRQQLHRGCFLLHMQPMVAVQFVSPQQRVGCLE